jgi:RNA polymerase sigma factor (TIGR02999 family)
MLASAKVISDNPVDKGSKIFSPKLSREFRLTLVGRDSGISSERENAMAEHQEKHPEEMQPAAELLPKLYQELHRLAVALSRRLPPGQTLQPTALVHEAYLRLVRQEDSGWGGPRHFFGAAALAMRDILVEQARRKVSQKHGGQRQRVELTEELAWIEPPADDLLALDEAIQLLREKQPHLAEVVMLRYYTGLTIEEAAEVVGRSASTLKREWRFARAWLARQLGAASGSAETTSD